MPPANSRGERGPRKSRRGPRRGARRACEPGFEGLAAFGGASPIAGGLANEGLTGAETVIHADLAGGPARRRGCGRAGGADEERRRRVVRRRRPCGPQRRRPCRPRRRRQRRSQPSPLECRGCRRRRRSRRPRPECARRNQQRRSPTRNPNPPRVAWRFLWPFALPSFGASAPELAAPSARATGRVRVGF